MVCGKTIFTAVLIRETNSPITQMINTSAVNASGFLPDSMMLLIHSHPINLVHQAHVYNPSSCPTVFQHLFSAIVRIIAFLFLIKADVFMPEHTVRFIEVFHPNQTSFHLHDQTQPFPDDPLIQPPSKNVHLFLTIQPFSTYPCSPKTL